MPRLNPQEFEISPFARPVNLGMMRGLVCRLYLGNGKFIPVQFYLVLQVKYSLLHCHVRWIG